VAENNASGKIKGFHSVQNDKEATVVDGLISDDPLGTVLNYGKICKRIG
jgi:hypothetical protein